MDIKLTLIHIVHQHIPHCTIMLFGSRARKNNQEGADYDIALDAGHQIPLQTLWDIQSDIEESNIPVFVDLVDIHSASETFLNAIQKDLILWTKK